MSHRPPQDIYASHLLTDRGYPLWVPEPDTMLLELERPDGLAIGDVGVVHPGGGYFDVLFNICLPPDHPFHRAVGVPEGFMPIKLKDEDIEITPNMGTSSCITSHSVTNVKAPVTQSGSSALDFEFELHPKEGALLILPEGADRYVLRNKSPFLDHMIQYGADWYRFAREQRGWIIDRDALYLITGFYKTGSWSLGAYDDISTAGGLPAKFRARQIGRDDVDIRSAYTWQTAHPSNRRIGPVRNSDGARNQAVFICGFKSALRDVAAEAGCCTILPSLSRNFRCRKTDIRPNAGQVSNAVLRKRVLRVPIEIRRFPEVSRVFHPCDIINEYLLEKEPSASVAISHDGDWIVLLENGLLKPDQLLQEECIKKAVSRLFCLQSQEGAVYLRRKRFVPSVDPSEYQRASTVSDRWSVTEAGGPMARFLRLLLLSVIPRKLSKIRQVLQSRSTSSEPFSESEKDEPGPKSSINQVSLPTESETARNGLPRARSEDVSGLSVEPPPVARQRQPRRASVAGVISGPSDETPAAQEWLPKKTAFAEDIPGSSKDKARPSLSINRVSLPTEFETTRYWLPRTRPAAAVDIPGPPVGSSPVPWQRQPRRASVAGVISGPSVETLAAQEKLLKKKTAFAEGSCVDPLHVPRGRTVRGGR